MKRIILAAALAAAAVIPSAAEAAGGDGLSLGYSVGERHGDFSLGVEATSPYFASGRLAVRAGGELLYKEGASAASGAETWEPYYLARLGAVLLGRSSGPFRLYGEFGGVCVLPTAGLYGDPAPLPGIYGHFGFELPVAEGSGGSYFIEMGSTGVFGPGADRMALSPSLANGFAARAGFRWAF